MMDLPASVEAPEGVGRLHVLLVEDNPADVRLTQAALCGGASRSSLTVVQDGQEALDYLRGEGSYAQRRMPDLVLLDLNLPRKDGRQVLREMHVDERLRMIPVIVLSTSADAQDVKGAYAEGANCYITKPMDFVSYARIVKLIETFWCEVAPRPAVRGWEGCGACAV